MLSRIQSLAIITCSITIAFMASLFAKDENENRKLLDQYIESQGLNNSIVFDSSNIKQYWIDKSVVAKDNSILIQLNKKNAKVSESIPLKIQLANISESLDCTVKIITTDPVFSFSILNNKSTNISESIKQESFLTYHILDSTFHLEDTDNFIFSLVFNSESSSSISIERVVLSFEKNKNSIFNGKTEYDYVVQEMKDKAQKVSNSEVRYLIDSKRNVLYLRVPSEISDINYYYYLVTPTNKKDMLPGREQYGYNNFDGEIQKGFINHGTNTDDNNKYLKVYLPAYEYSSLEVGQLDLANKRKIWTLKFNSDSVKTNK